MKLCQVLKNSVGMRLFVFLKSKTTVKTEAWYCIIYYSFCIGGNMTRIFALSISIVGASPFHFGAPIHRNRILSRAQCHFLNHSSSDFATVRTKIGFSSSTWRAIRDDSVSPVRSIYVCSMSSRDAGSCHEAMIDSFTFRIDDFGRQFLFMSCGLWARLLLHALSQKFSISHAIWL